MSDIPSDVIKTPPQTDVGQRTGSAQETVIQRASSAPLPATLQDTLKTPTDGQVISRENAAEYIVRTRDGDVNLRAEGATTEAPPVDARVRVEIVRTPVEERHATPRDSARPVQVQVEILPQQVRAADETAQRAVRVTQTPVQVEIQAAPSAPAQTPQLPPVSEGSVIRVEAYPAELAQPITSQAVATEFTQRVALPPYSASEALPPVNALNTQSALLVSVSNAPQLPRLEALVDLTTPQAILPKTITQFIVQPETILRTDIAPQTQPSQSLPTQILPASAAVSVTSAHITETVFDALLPAPPLTVTSPAWPILSNVQTESALPVITPPTQVSLAVSLPSVSLPFIPAPPLILSEAKAGSMQAVLAGKNANNVPILQVTPPQATPATMFSSIYAQSNTPETSQFLLFFGSNNGVAEGSSVTLTPQPSPQMLTNTVTVLPDIPAHMAALPVLGPLLFNTGEWPLMNDLHQTLARAAPQTAQAFTGAAPSPTNAAQMMPAALFFIAAIKGGDINQWLGERATELLQKAGKSSALSQLSNEGQALARASRESVSDWRSMALPFYYDNSFQKMLLHTRQEQRHEADDPSGEKSTRFLFDLHYDRVGDVQLDGLFRAGRMDLILRTEQHFSQTMQAEMRRLYAGAIEQAGVVGELSFQNALQSWVTIDYKEAAFGGDA